MPPKKNLITVLKSFVLSYVRDGEPVEQEILTRGPYGTMKIHDGGSVYLGTMDLVVSVAGLVQIVRGVILRIRASDGLLVAETKSAYRTESRFDNEGNEIKGHLVWEFLGDESRNLVAEAAAKCVPELATNIRNARAELKRRAAAA
jgi:hypothetical protein